jgi:hypothetical protein
MPETADQCKEKIDNTLKASYLYAYEKFCGSANPYIEDNLKKFLDSMQFTCVTGNGCYGSQSNEHMEIVGFNFAAAKASCDLELEKIELELETNKIYDSFPNSIMPWLSGSYDEYKKALSSEEKLLKEQANNYESVFKLEIKRVLIERDLANLCCCKEPAVIKSEIAILQEEQDELKTLKK